MKPIKVTYAMRGCPEENAVEDCATFGLSNANYKRLKKAIERGVLCNVHAMICRLVDDLARLRGFRTACVTGICLDDEMRGYQYGNH